MVQVLLHQGLVLLVLLFDELEVLVTNESIVRLADQHGLLEIIEFSVAAVFFAVFFLRHLVQIGLAVQEFFVQFW